MNFKDRFPHLVQFFGGYFPDADLDDLTDKEVVLGYIKDSNKSEFSKKSLEKAKQELSILIYEIDSYWQDVEDEANRYFEDSQGALKWLNMIKLELER